MVFLYFYHIKLYARTSGYTAKLTQRNDKKKKISGKLFIHIILRV